MKIEMRDGKLYVPDQASIYYIEGDGIGHDILPQALRLFDHVISKAYKQKKSVNWEKLEAGAEAFEKTGQYLPDETLTKLRENLVAIKGPLMTPVGEGHRSINVTLRQELDLFACLRPVEYFTGIDSPVKRPELIDMTIFRENTEDIYAGIEFASQTEQAKKLIDFLSTELDSHKIRFPETSAIGIKPVSSEGSKRLIRSAFEYAISQGKQRLTIVHKGNIMKFTEGGFRKWAYEVAQDYPTFTKLDYDELLKTKGWKQANESKEKALSEGKIFVDDVIADNFLQQILLNPQDFDVVATLNLNGDYISDALAAQVGGIGIAPGGNINYQTGHAVFEATHGTAPDIAGKNLANPSSVILSAVMMFDYMGWTEVAQLLKEAVRKALADGKMTKDLGGQLLTSDFIDELIANL